jgi:hypothetical protein
MKYAFIERIAFSGTLEYTQVRPRSRAAASLPNSVFLQAFNSR